MHLAPVFDFPEGVVFVLFGPAAAILLFIPTVLIEAKMLRALLHIQKPVRASFFMNLTSSLVGGFLSSTFLPMLISLGVSGATGVEVIGYDILYNIKSGEPDSILSTALYFLILLVVMWGLSVLIESSVLSPFASDVPKEETWQAVININLVTHALLLLTWVGFLVWVLLN